MENISNSLHLINQYALDLEPKLYEKLNDYNIINCLLIVASSMISYYGKKYKAHIYDVILNTNYVIDDSNNFNIVHTLRDLFIKDINEYRSNIVMCVCNIDKDSDIDLDTYSIDYSLFIMSRWCNSIDLLEGLIREINKIFLSRNNTFSWNNDKVMLRSGISNVSVNDSSVIEDKKTVNDVISYLQIEDILKMIKRLEYTGNNKELNKLLNTFKEYDMDTFVLDCCLPLVNLFRPLFKLNYLKEFINNNMFEGNIENICNEFDSVLGSGSFDRMSKKLDKLYYEFYIGRLGNNISEYNFSKEYVSIRDNFVNKYIRKKYT